MFYFILYIFVKSKVAKIISCFILSFIIFIYCVKSNWGSVFFYLCLCLCNFPNTVSSKDHSFPMNYLGKFLKNHLTIHELIYSRNLSCSLDLCSYKSINSTVPIIVFFPTLLRYDSQITLHELKVIQCVDLIHIYSKNDYHHRVS